jgi:hypothetical protein
MARERTKEGGGEGIFVETGDTAEKQDGYVEVVKKELGDVATQ